MTYFGRRCQWGSVSKIKICPYFIQTDTKSKFCPNSVRVLTTFCLYFIKIQIWTKILPIFRNLSKCYPNFVQVCVQIPNFVQITSKQGTRTLRIKWTTSGQIFDFVFYQKQILFSLGPKNSINFDKLWMYFGFTFGQNFDKC